MTKPATIEIDVKSLRQALKGVVDVVEGRNTIPILANVLLRAHAGKLTLMATDLDLWAERHLDLPATSPKASICTTVPAKLFAAMIAKLPAEATMTITVVDGGKLRCAAGRARFDLLTLPADDFPEPKAWDWTHQFEMAGFDLQALIHATRFAISTDETRYYLNGIYLHAAEREREGGLLLTLRGATTDGHRLAVYDVPQPDGSGALAGVIMPRKAMALIDKLLGELTEGAKPDIAICDRGIRFDLGDVVVTSKLIDGQFPDYTRVIPTMNDKLVTLAPKALAEATERVAVIASEKSQAVKVSLEADRMTLSVTSVEHGTATEELPCDYAGPAFDIGFNAKYLLEVLAHIQGDTAELAIGEASGPVRIRDTNDEARGLFVLMPLRV